MAELQNTPQHSFDAAPPPVTLPTQLGEAPGATQVRSTDAAWCDFLKKRPGFDGVQRLDISPMDPADWLRIDELAPLQLEYKRELIERYPGLVTALEEGFDTEGRELVSSVASYLVERYPALFSRNGDSVVSAVTGESYSMPLDPLRALQVAGQLVQEDLVLVSRRSPSEPARVVGGVLCFPSNWSIADKIGSSISEIHGAISGMTEEVRAKVDLLLERVKPGRPLERINFFIHRTDELALIPELRPTAEPLPPIEFDTAGTSLYLRNERQTLWRLPETGALVFGIRTYVHRFDVLPPPVAGRLLELIEASPLAYIRAKEWGTGDLAAIVDYLQRRAGQAHEP